jgi:long-subunit acyl-CoA synthetase (AMP-forming)
LRIRTPKASLHHGPQEELIVSSTGKKIHPARVEALFKTEPLISQVLLVGDRLPYLTALFTINTTAAEALKGMDIVAQEIQRTVARVNDNSRRSNRFANSGFCRAIFRLSRAS